MDPNRIPLRDIMTRGVTSVPMDFTVKEVASIMAEHDVSGVAVTDHTGEIMGVISEMDMLRAIMDESLMNSTAESIMTPHVLAVKPSTTLKTAAAIMMDRGIHRVIVLSEPGVGASDRPVGILCASDIVKVMTRT